MGITVSKPLKKIEEAINTIRKLINGDLVCNIDSTWEINRIKMEYQMLRKENESL